MKSEVNKILAYCRMSDDSWAQDDFNDDEFENEEFLTGVKQNYLDLAQSNDNFKIIDANNGPNKVSSDIKKAVAPLFDICKDCIL